jgi:hypothetical protein
MRNEKALIHLLRGLVTVISDEVKQNLQFAEKIEALLSDLPSSAEKAKPTPKPKKDVALPDIHAEWTTRGEDEFRLWLRDQPIEVLRGVISAQDFDATRRTAKWKDHEKLAHFIADAHKSRIQRGSAFMG